MSQDIRATAGFVQIALLAVYLWLFMGDSFAEIVAVDRIATVFTLLPLLAAFLTERWVERRPRREVVVERLGWLPLPLLGLVVFLIAASQVQAVVSALAVLGQVLGAFIGYLIAAAVIGLVLGRLFRLAPEASRAVIFSLGTRNSILVLPLPLALSAPWETAVVVIVFQSLVERSAWSPTFGQCRGFWCPRLRVRTTTVEDPVSRCHWALLAASVLEGYVDAMVFRISCRPVVLLAVFFFALGGVLHGFGAAAITPDMPTMAGSEAPASEEDCGHCGIDDDMSAVSAACETVCTSPTFLASSLSSHSMSAEAHARTRISIVRPGRAGPPDPHPPKPVSLS